MARAIGVVPAAGAGSRLWPFRATKELIQVGYDTVHDGGPGRLVPRTAIDHVLSAMRRGGVDDVLVVLSPAKWEVFRYLGTGREVGLNLAYLCQEQPRGMPAAIDLAHPFLRDRTVCMGMPDTIVGPADCFARLRAFHEDHRADLSLGVFPTDQPHMLAPVVMAPQGGQVRQIVDKPEEPPVANTWGIAVWSASFTELLHDMVATAEPAGDSELLLSDAFSRAVRSGLRVFGLPFDEGSYHDVGTSAGLIRARALLEPRPSAEEDPRSGQPGAADHSAADHLSALSL
jgi:glucose-1-phosphate thymidylyltransferase